MCGRLYQTLPLQRLIKIANAKNTKNPQQYNSSYNVCPTTYIPAIKVSKLYLDENKNKQTEVKNQQFNKQQNRELQFMPWGYKTNFSFIVNGRIQELLNKKTFLNFIQNRCVVIMEGYYEWNQKKQPFSFRPKGIDHFLVAALYSQTGQIIILTKDATPQLAAVHHRMPVILSHEQVNLWLNPNNTKIINQVIQKSLLKKEKQIWKNVGCAKLAPYVSSIKEKSNKCLMTIEEYKKQLDKTGLMRFWKKAPKVQAVNKYGEVVIANKPKTDNDSEERIESRQINKFQAQISEKKQKINGEYNQNISDQNQVKKEVIQTKVSQ